MYSCTPVGYTRYTFSGFKLRLDAFVSYNQQESTAITDKPARRESLPKIAPIRRAYNVVADDTSLSLFV